MAFCDKCGWFSIWLNDQMVFPDQPTAPPASPDMPDEILTDYDEARSVAERRAMRLFFINSNTIKYNIAMVSPPKIGAIFGKIDSTSKPVAQWAIPVIAYRTGKY